jgi:hypothetical protein
MLVPNASNCILIYHYATYYTSDQAEPERAKWWVWNSFYQRTSKLGKSSSKWYTSRREEQCVSSTNPMEHFRVLMRSIKKWLRSQYLRFREDKMETIRTRQKSLPRNQHNQHISVVRNNDSFSVYWKRSMKRITESVSCSDKTGFNFTNGWFGGVL